MQFFTAMSSTRIRAHTTTDVNDSSDAVVRLNRLGSPSWITVDHVRQANSMWWTHIWCLIRCYLWCYLLCYCDLQHLVHWLISEQIKCIHVIGDIMNLISLYNESFMPWFDHTVWYYHSCCFLTLIWFIILVVPLWKYFSNSGSVKTRTSKHVVIWYQKKSKSKRLRFVVTQCCLRKPSLITVPQ